MPAKHFTVEVPYNLTVRELIEATDVDTAAATLDGTLLWMANNLSADEAPRVFMAASLLMDLGCPPNEAIHTALVMERG